jgi:hypothetical protein
VTLHVVGTPERRFDLAEGGEGVRQKVSARLAKDQLFVLWTLLYASAEGTARRPFPTELRRLGPNVVLLIGSERVSEKLAGPVRGGSPDRPLTADRQVSQSRDVLTTLQTPSEEGEDAPVVLAFIGTVDLGGLHVTADMGLVSAERLTVAGCRELSVGGQERHGVRSLRFSSPEGITFGWDLANNTFEAGKPGFGLLAGVEPPGLREQRDAVAGAVREALAAAARQPEWSPPEVSTVCSQPRVSRSPERSEGAAEWRSADGTPVPDYKPEIPALPVAERRTLPPPVSLAAADLDGDGGDELLLYDADGKPRFGEVAFRAAPVAADFDGQGRRDVAFALDRAVAVYHPDGTLRWRQELTNSAAALSVGDLDGDGREELGLSLHNWALVLNHAGERLIDEEVYRYNGIGGAFGDVDGDGRTEFVAVTCSGVNVLVRSQARNAVECRQDATPLRFVADYKRRTAGFQSFFGMAPGRVWLRDLDGDGVPECYLGGGGTDLAGYDLRAVQCRWKFNGAAIHPRDAALGDVDGDGQPELVSGGGDGFLYVVGRDGAFRFSRSVGAGITALAVVPGGAGESDSLVVGLETGQVLLLGRDLQPLGQAQVGDEAVRHLAVLRRTQGGPAIIAADDTGQSVRVELGP